uniref:Uncharacterized protein n=1 Tax=Ascaris lumbricoides TaxID=6252 RepID=A0A0M3ISN8_ASCLU
MKADSATAGTGKVALEFRRVKNSKHTTMSQTSMLVEEPRRTAALCASTLVMGICVQPTKVAIESVADVCIRFLRTAALCASTLVMGICVQPTKVAIESVADVCIRFLRLKPRIKTCAGRGEEEISVSIHIVEKE